MSLINSMLRDLEDRHAFVSMRSPHVLNDLRSAADFARESRVAAGRGLLLTGMLVILGLAVLYLARGGIARVLPAGAVTSPPPAAARLPSPASPPAPERESVARGAAAIDLGAPGLQLKLDRLPALMPAAELPAPAPVLLRLDNTGDTQAGTITMHFSRPPEYTLHLLGNPFRLLVQFDGAELPPGTMEGFSPAGLVTAVRSGVDGGNGRMVFDLAGPAAINSAEVLRGNDGGHAFVVRLDALNAVPEAVPPRDIAAYEPPGEEQTEAGSAGPAMQVSRAGGSGPGVDTEFRLGVDAWRAGDPAAAIGRFVRILDREPDHLGARRHLVMALAENGDGAGARRYAGEGLRYHPDDPVLLRAYGRLLFDAGQPAAALEVLMRNPPAVSDDPDYHALAAAILQDQGMHGDAAEHYGRLLQLDPANGRWWTGLGISLEALGRTGDALRAFSRARTDAGLPADLERFVSERIRSLGNAGS